MPSSKAYTGVVEAYWQAALYEEALVALNTMKEVGSEPTVETYNALIHAYARGGLYKESEAILLRTREFGVPQEVHSFNGVIEAFQQGTGLVDESEEQWIILLYTLFYSVFLLSSTGASFLCFSLFSSSFLTSENSTSLY